MTYIADRYRPPALRAAVGLFGRPSVVRHADFVIIIGGGHSTLDEMDLAISMGKRILPFPPSGGAARQAYERMQSSARLRAWLPADIFAALGSCGAGGPRADSHMADLSRRDGVSGSGRGRRPDLERGALALRRARKRPQHAVGKRREPTGSRG